MLMWRHSDYFYDTHPCMLVVCDGGLEFEETLRQSDLITHSQPLICSNSPNHKYTSELFFFFLTLGIYLYLTLRIYLYWWWPLKWSLLTIWNHYDFHFRQNFATDINTVFLGSVAMSCQWTNDWQW